MLTTSDVPHPRLVLPENGSTNTRPRVLSQTLSEEDKLVLYSVLQDLANEIRRIDRERQKHQQETQQPHNPLDI